MTVRPPLTRAELLALPAVINLPTLARALGVGEFGIRERARQGELAALGIRCLRVGVQYRIATADVWRALGIAPDGEGGPSPPEPPTTITAGSPSSRDTTCDHRTA